MRPNDPLMDAWWKTERAKHHLNELREQIDAFMADDPVTVTKIEDPEQRVSRYQAVFKQPHVWFFLIAGDIFQCLRTALDQSVWWLADVSSLLCKRRSRFLFLAASTEVSRPMNLALHFLLPGVFLS